MENFNDLSEDEKNWVIEYLLNCVGGKEYKTPPPSEKAHKTVVELLERNFGIKILEPVGSLRSINCDVCGNRVISLPEDAGPVREYYRIVCSPCAFGIQERAHQAGLEGKVCPKIKGLE